MENGSLVSEANDSQSVNLGDLPTPAAAPELNDMQKLFTERFKDNEALKEFATHEDPFKAIADKLATPAAPVGGLKVPTAESTPEEIAAFREAIGAPADKTGYKYELPKIEDEAIKKLIPEGMPAPFADAFAEIASKHNLPAAAWTDLTAAYNQLLIEDAKNLNEHTQKSHAAIQENWNKTHGANGPQVSQVFQKYFASANDAESQVLSTLTAEQVAALGSVVYKRDKMMMSEDTIDTSKMGSSTMTDAEYVMKRSKLLSDKAKLDNSGQAWSPEAASIKAQLEQLKDQFSNSRK